MYCPISFRSVVPFRSVNYTVPGDDDDDDDCS